MASPEHSQTRQHHEALFHAVTGVLGAAKTKALGQAAAAENAMRVLDALAPDIAGGLDLELPLADGLPLGVAFAQLDASVFNPVFMDAFLTRFGPAAVFPGPPHDPVDHWAKALSKTLDSTWSGAGPGKAGPMAWVLAHAPDEQMTGQALDRLAGKLEKHRTNQGLDPAYGAVLERLAPHVQADPARPATRWVPQDVLAAQALDVDALVLAPSGHRRRLADLVALSGPTRNPNPQPLSCLVEPPHRRLNDLCALVIDPDIPLETARQRLWSYLPAKPDVLLTLIAWHAQPPARRADCPARIERIVRARDAHGRGLLAFLAGTWLKDARPDVLARAVCDAGLLQPADALSADGHGLVEQAMVGLRQAEHHDALENRSPSEWALEFFGAEIIAGPAERRPALVADLVDAMLPHHIPHLVVKPLLAAHDSPALEQAQRWSRFCQVVHGARLEHTASHPGADKQRQRRDGALQIEIQEASARLLEHLHAHPHVLAVGQAEFEQWKEALFTPLLRSTSYPNASRALARRLPDLERAVRSSEMDMALPAPASSAPRQRM